jgi:hypothetical protein
MTSAEVQSLLLRVLAAGGDTRLGRGRTISPKLSSLLRRRRTEQLMARLWRVCGR